MIRLSKFLMDAIHNKNNKNQSWASIEKRNIAPKLKLLDPVGLVTSLVSSNNHIIFYRLVKVNDCPAGLSSPQVLEIGEMLLWLF